MDRKPIAGWKRCFLNIFIALHVAIILFWGLPDSGFRNRMARPFEKYVSYMGLWHMWGMFAPMPLVVHFDLRAKVKYRDGSVVEWVAPRPEDSPVLGRVYKERYRKWREKVRTDEYKMVWADAGRFIARQNFKDPANPPVEVKLTRYWVRIPPPNLRRDYQPMPTGFNPTNSFTFATVAIKPEDLQ